MTQKSIVNLPIGPGVYTEQTERGAVGQWFTADKVRFRKGLAEKIGGWVQVAGPVIGTCRRIHDWTSLDGTSFSAIATDTKLYLWDGSILHDITPIRDAGSLTNPFDTTNMSTTVVVNHTAHGAQAGDYVRFTGASAGGGITVNGEYEIDSVIDADSYNITHGSAATSTVAGTGGTVSYEYDISAGAESVVTATGYGTGGYGTTAIRAQGQLTNPFDTTNMSSTVVVNHTGHGVQAQVGFVEYVSFSNASAGGGLTVDGVYGVSTILGANSYEVVDDETATSTATGTGGTVDYIYYENEGYGRPRSGSTIKLPLRTWSLDNWGEDLLACPAGGAIYWWDRSTGTSSRADVLDAFGTPLNNQYIIISQRDRHLISLGAYDYFNNRFDPLLIRWGSTEDLNDWIPTSTNTAGDIRLYRGSKIVTGVRSRLELVVFTDVSVHTMPFVGAQAGVFGLNIVGENVSILGPNCAVPVDHRVFFMAEADFYMYDGIVRVLPCTVRNHVYKHLNVDQKDKIYGGLNREFNEVWWFYPSRDPDSWVQQDFSLGLPPGYSLATASSGGTLGYSYAFNSAGYTEIVSTADNNYEHVYVLTNEDPIQTPLEAEYAVEFAFHEDTAATRWGGMTFLYTDVTGTIDTDSDDCQAIFVEADYTTDGIRMRRKTAAGVVAMDNDPGLTSFTAVLGQAAQLDTKYIFTVQVNLTQITVWLNGTQVYQFNLSANEQALYTSGTFGFYAQSNADNNDEFKFYNLATGPIGVLSATDFDISPIEVNHYVIFNYEENTWSIGKLARTAWADRSPQLEKPYATGTDGFIYQHETGTDDNGAAMSARIASYDMEIPGAGEQLMHADQIIPDFETLEGSVNIYLTGRKYPQEPNRISKGPYPIVSSTRKVSTRIRARQVALEVESTTTGDKWRMGTWRARVGGHGRRG